MFWACSGRVIFASILKKKTGECSGHVPGVLFLLQFLKKKLGRVPGVFSVFQCVQCVVSSDPHFCIMQLFSADPTM